MRPAQLGRSLVLVVALEKLHVWLVRVRVAAIIGAVGRGQRGVKIIGDIWAVVVLLLSDLVTSGEDRCGAVDEHVELLLVRLGLVRRVACSVDKNIGGMLADLDGIQGVGHLGDAELVRGLLGVPLGACAVNTMLNKRIYNLIR